LGHNRAGVIPNDARVDIAAAILISLLCGLCIVVTLVGLPGTWIMLAGALIGQWFIPDLYTWWTLGAAGLLCIGAEIAETLSGAAGAAASGASKRAAVGAIIGGIAGAIIGTIVLAFLPLIGTIIGGAIGAGATAMVLELSIAREVRASSSVFAVGKGAAIGRLLATVIKTVFAVAVAIVLIIGAIW
jgi:uncharacterized protein YqgC (DUF456 family)